jgi:hypothetical protein
MDKLAQFLKKYVNEVIVGVLVFLFLICQFYQCELLVILLKEDPFFVTTLQIDKDHPATSNGDYFGNLHAALMVISTS